MALFKATVAFRAEQCGTKANVAYKVGRRVKILSNAG